MKNILIFLSGAAIGSVITWKLLEKKYKDLADEEIKSVVDTFRQKEDSILDSINDNKVYREETEQYNKESDYVEKKIKKEPETFVIADSQFAEFEDYDTQSFLYYEDGIVADADTDEILENPKDIIGDALMHFDDDPEEEAVYVRNENKKIDYEILRSEKKYTEIIKS